MGYNQKVKLIFLGTNGWYSSPTGDTPCILIETDNHYIIFDAGNGFYKIDQYITENKPISLFISHFHIDHTSGLHMLNKFTFQQGIDVYVGENRTNDFKTLVNPPYTIGFHPQSVNVADLKMSIRLHELTEQQKPFPMKAFEQYHAYTDHGFRIEVENKIIAYTGDCGYTDAATSLAQNADILISECAAKKIADQDLWGHLDPYLAATLAKEAGVKQLFLTHFGANTYTTLQDRD